MLVCREEAFVPAPIARVWELVGQPSRHPEWWPQIVQVRGQDFGRGCRYCQVTQGDGGTVETDFMVERIEELKELRVRCDDTGLYMRWLLTDAMEGTFVDAEFGIDHKSATAAEHGLGPPSNAVDLRAWLHDSVRGLCEAAAG
jgi:uncharacterized protein YndB with AHSA1/START domain